MKVLRAATFLLASHQTVGSQVAPSNNPWKIFEQASGSSTLIARNVYTRGDIFQREENLPTTVTADKLSLKPSGSVVTPTKLLPVKQEQAEEVLASRGGGAHVVCPTGVDWGGPGSYCLAENIYYCDLPRQPTTRLQSNCAQGCEVMPPGQIDICRRANIQPPPPPPPPPPPRPQPQPQPQPPLYSQPYPPQYPTYPDPQYPPQYPTYPDPQYPPQYPTYPEPQYPPYQEPSYPSNPSNPFNPSNPSNSPAYGNQCSQLRDCYSCLNMGQTCLWDPNTLSGTCKPQGECDYTYMVARGGPGSAAQDYNTACVRSVSQCAARPPPGAVLEPNYGADDQCKQELDCHHCTTRMNCLWQGGRCTKTTASTVSCNPYYGCSLYPEQCPNEPYPPHHEPYPPHQPQSPAYPSEPYPPHQPQYPTYPDSQYPPQYPTYPESQNPPQYPTYPDPRYPTYPESQYPPHQPQYPTYPESQYPPQYPPQYPESQYPPQYPASQYPPQYPPQYSTYPESQYPPYQEPQYPSYQQPQYPYQEYHGNYPHQEPYYPPSSGQTPYQPYEPQYTYPQNSGEYYPYQQTQQPYPNDPYASSDSPYGSSSQPSYTVTVGAVVEYH